jgi:hypothetical protein
VGDNVLVTLLVALVLGDKVQVVAAQDNGALHVRLDNLAAHDAAADRHAAGERALFVNVVAGLRRLRHFVAEADFLPVARRARRRARIVLLQAGDGRSAKRSENAGLLLEGTLILLVWSMVESKGKKKNHKKKKNQKKKKKKKKKKEKKKLRFESIGLYSKRNKNKNNPIVRILSSLNANDKKSATQKKKKKKKKIT